MSLLRTERHGHVTVWTLDDPATHHAISSEPMISAIEDAIDSANRDGAVHAVVLTATGSTFSSGGNIKDMDERRGMFAGSAAQIRRNYQEGIQRIPRAMQRCSVPTIAAVNGPAVGAGCDLAMMCDLRVASTRASFAESFVRLGLVSGDGGTWFLPRVIGISRAHEMALTGRSVSAQEAERWAMVSAVVEPEDLLSTALTLAESIAAQPRDALVMTKRLLREGIEGSLDSVLDMAASMQAIAHSTPEHEERVRAMLTRLAERN